jgi:tRNA pseudouridine38-40 synthase
MYIFKIAYDGKLSFQTQPHGETVCGKISNALLDCGYLDNEDRVPLYHGGRTDRGVAALGNYVVYEMDKKPVLPRVQSKLKWDGIWVLGCKEIEIFPEIEHRHYQYTLPNKNHDVELMKKASEKLIGTHYFQNLSKRDKTKVKDPVRTLYDIKISSNDYFITIDIFGESFLWNMVRRIIRLLSDIGKHKIENPEKFIELILSEDYKKGYPPSPAEGLILVDVKTNIDIDLDSYVIRNLKNSWEKSLNNSLMRLGLCKTVLSKT